MNNKRRKVLTKALKVLAGLREPVMDRETARCIVKDALGKVETCLDEEEAALDARPDCLLWSSVSSNMQENLSDLSDALGDLECVMEDLEAMSEFDYETIKNDIGKAVKAINIVICR